MTRKTLTSQKLGILLGTATTTINPPETQRRGKLWLICLQKVPLFLYQIKPHFSLLMSYFSSLVASVFTLVSYEKKCVDSFPMSTFPVADAEQKVHLQHVSPCVRSSQFQVPIVDLSLWKNSLILHWRRHRWILHHPVAKCREPYDLNAV